MPSNAKSYKHLTKKQKPMSTVALRPHGLTPKPLDVLREKLRKRPYMRAVQTILPNKTPWEIRNAVNGKTSRPDILVALELAIEQMDRAEQQTNDSLVQALKDANLR